MLILDPWSARRLVGGVVAYHEAKSRNKDAEKAFWEISGMRFKTATEGHRATVPTILIDYPDLATAALAVLDLDYEYRTRLRPVMVGEDEEKIDVQEWTPEQLEDWKARRKVSADRLDMLRIMIDHEAKGFDFKSPA